MPGIYHTKGHVDHINHNQLTQQPDSDTAAFPLGIRVCGDQRTDCQNGGNVFGKHGYQDNEQNREEPRLFEQRIRGRFA